MEIQIYLIGFDLWLLVLTTLLGMTVSTIGYVKRLPNGKRFDIVKAWKTSIIATMLLLWGLIIALMVWFSYEPESFGKFFYYPIQLFSAGIVGETLALGLSWILKGHRNSLLNLGKT